MKKLALVFVLLVSFIVGDAFAAGTDVKIGWTLTTDTTITQVLAVKSQVDGVYDTANPDAILAPTTTNYTFLNVPNGTWFFTTITFDGTDYSLVCDQYSETLNATPGCNTLHIRLP